MRDDDGACLGCHTSDVLLLHDDAGVLACLVEVAETAHGEVVHALCIGDGQVEVAHHEAGEVVPCQLEEQLVLVERVWHVGEDEEEVRVALLGESLTGQTVSIAEGGGAAVPHVGEVELGAVQLSALLHSVYYHACHLADFALRIVLHHRLHTLQAGARVAVVESCQTLNEQEAVAVGTHGETLLRELRIAVYLLEAIRLECLVCCSVDGVLYLHTVARILGEVRVGEYRRQFGVGTLLLHPVEIRLSLGRVALARVEQEEVVVYLVFRRAVGVLRDESHQVLLAQVEVVQLVLEDDARLEQTLLYYIVAGGTLFLRKRYLRQIVLAFVWVVDSRIHTCLALLLLLLYGGNGVALLVGKLSLIDWLQICAHDGDVAALPVVLVLSFAPCALERLASLQHGLWVVEIPRGCRLIAQRVCAHLAV